MFQDLNPLDKSTAMLEIGVMLLGAAIIGFVTAWFIARSRKPADQAPGLEAEYNANLKKNAETITRLKGILDKAQREYNALEKKFIEAQQRLKEKAKPAIAYSTEIDDVKNRLDAEKTLNEKLRKEIARLSSEASKSKPSAPDSSSNPRVDQLQKEVAALTSQNKELQRRLDSGEAEKEDSGLVDRIQKELTAANAQNEELRKKLSAQVADPDQELERKLRQQTIELVQKTADLASLQNKVATLEMKLDSAPAAGPETKKQLATLEKELEARQANIGKLENQLKKAEEVAREATTTALEIPKLKAQIKALEVENLSLKSSPAVVQADSDNSAGREALAKAESRADSLKKALEESEMKLKEAIQNVPATPAPSQEIEWLRKEKDDQEEEIAELEETILNLEKDNAQMRARMRDKTGTQAEKQIEELQKERDLLQKELRKLRKSKPSFASDNTSTSPSLPDFSHLTRTSDTDKDTLTMIGGIDAATEMKLNGLGLFTFSQISQLRQEDIEKLELVLELASGTLKKEKWVKQAKKLTK